MATLKIHGYRGAPETLSPQTVEKLVVRLWEEVSLALCRSKQAAPSSVSSVAMLLLDGSRWPGLASPHFAAQVEMNIQELKRHSHLWHSGLWAGIFWKAPCPAACQHVTGSQLPFPAERPPRIPRSPPSCSRARVSLALAPWPFGAGHAVGFLANWLPGGRLSGPGAAWEPGRSKRQWQLGQPQQSCAFSLPGHPASSFPSTVNFPRHLKGKCSNRPEANP